MRFNFSRLFVGFCLICSTGVSSIAFGQTFEETTEPSIWNGYTQLPQLQEWNWMYQEAQEIADDLNSGGGKYKLVYKAKGGSSHQVLVVRTQDEKTMGLWSAPNHATYILGEIFAFNLARLLNRSEWAMPGVRMTLSGRGREAALVSHQTPSPAARACNREHILTYMRSNPYYIVGVYKSFLPDQKPQDIPEIVDRKDQFRLDPTQFIVKLIDKNGPRPANQSVYLSKSGALSSSPGSSVVAKSTDTELAKQLSFMTLVDALNSQRDRFGPYGSNMQGMVNSKTGAFNISLIDNGGIADAANTLSLKYFIGSPGRPGVSRFEREIFDRILALDDFISGKEPQFMEFRNVDELKAALGYESSPSRMGPIGKPGAVCQSNHMFLFAPLKTQWDKRWNNFVQGLKIVANHMRKFQNDSDAFFD